MGIVVWTRKEINNLRNVKSKKATFYAVGSVYTDGMKYYRLITDDLMDTSYFDNSESTLNYLYSLRSFEVSESLYCELLGEERILNCTRGLDKANCLLEDGSNYDEKILYVVTRKRISGNTTYSTMVDMHGNLYIDSGAVNLASLLGMTVVTKYSTSKQDSGQNVSYYFFLLMGRLHYRYACSTDCNTGETKVNFQFSYYYLICRNILNMCKNTGNIRWLDHIISVGLYFDKYSSPNYCRVFSYALTNMFKYMFMGTSCIPLEDYAFGTGPLYYTEGVVLQLGSLSLLAFEREKKLTDLLFKEELVDVFGGCKTKETLNYLWCEKPINTGGLIEDYEEIHTMMYLPSAYLAPSITVEVVLNTKTGVVMFKNVEKHNYNDRKSSISDYTDVFYYGSTYDFLTKEKKYSGLHTFEFSSWQKRLELTDKKESESETEVLDKFIENLLSLGYTTKRSTQKEYVFFDEFKSLWLNEHDFVSVRSYLPDSSKKYEYRMDLYHDGELYKSVFGNFTDDALVKIGAMLKLENTEQESINKVYTTAIVQEALEKNIYLPCYTIDLFYTEYASKYIKLDLYNNGVRVAKFLPTGEICICYSAPPVYGYMRSHSMPHGISTEEIEISAIPDNAKESGKDFCIILFAFKSEAEAFEAYSELFSRKRDKPLGRELKDTDVLDFYGQGKVDNAKYYKDYYTTKPEDFVSYLCNCKINGKSIKNYLSTLDLREGMFEKLLLAWKGEN